MTDREAQIYEWIQSNPMISQEELAKRAGITRSSVGVHISNLTKKGYIQGKGYILSPKTYCTVVGGVNIDIGGRSDTTLIPKDSNPGHITQSLGGVGRNIAHNMTLLGMNVKLISAVGDDHNGRRVIESCSELGIDMTPSLFSKESSTSTYLFVSDDEGDMAVAISDMNIYDSLTPEFIQQKMGLINRSSLVIVDTNIPQATIEFLANNCTVPIFADPVSTTKAIKLSNILGKLHTITPNALEAEILTGIRISSDESLGKVVDCLLEKGLTQVYITLGARGVCSGNKSGVRIYPNLPCSLVNATGGGDAFMAGIAYAHTHGLDPEKTSLLGLGASSLAVESAQTINSKLSIAQVLQRADIEI